MHKNKKEQIALNNGKVLERLRLLKQIKSQKLKNDNEINLIDSTQTKQFKVQSNTYQYESKKQKKINKQSNKEITQKEYNYIKYDQNEQSAKNQQEEEMKRKKIDCSVNRKVTHNQSKQNCKQWKLQQDNKIVEFKGLRDERFLNDPAIGIEIDQSQTQKALEYKDGKNNNRLYKNTHCNCKTGCNQKCSCKQFPKNCTKQCKCNRELCCRLIRSVKETLQK